MKLLTDRLKQFLLVLFLIPTALLAQEEKESKWTVDGYMKSLQTLYLVKLPFTPTNGQSHLLTDNNLLHNRLNFSRELGGKASLKFSLRNRFLYGDVGDSEQLLEQFEAGNDYLDLSLETSALNYGAQSILDRLHIDFYLGDWEISLGRQRINWGISTFWNSNDIFNAFNFTDFDYEERPGSDALLIRKYIGFTSSIEFAIAGADQWEELKAGFLYRFNKKSYDFQALAGLSNGFLSLGGGWSGAIKQIGFKGEFNTFSPLLEGDDFAGSVSMEFDYINKNSLYFGAGFLFNSLGQTDQGINELLNFQISAQNLYPYKYTVFYSMNQSFSPIFTAGASVIYSAGEAHATFLSPNFNLSIAQNWDLGFFSQIVLDKQEKYQSPLKAFFLRIKYSF